MIFFYVTDFGHHRVLFCAFGRSGILDSFKKTCCNFFAKPQTTVGKHHYDRGPMVTVSVGLGVSPCVVPGRVCVCVCVREFRQEKERENTP